MLYYVQRGDTLAGIAARMGTTVGAILNANVICNPNLIFAGHALIIPQQGVDLPKAGAGPYYIIQPGDTLYCLSRQVGIPIQTLIEINQIKNPNLIQPGTELLVITPTTNDPEQLKLSWERIPDEDCEVFGFTEYGVYYLGSFEWAAFGTRSVRPLFELLGHRCEIVRMYAAISLGRMALDGVVKAGIESLQADPEIGDYIKIALRRITLAEQGRKRVHIMMTDNVLLTAPQLGSTSTPIPKDSEIIVLRWFMPSPTGEEGPVGGLQIYDRVQLAASGQIGYMPRLGNNQITFI
ncbi:MAG: LysM peptidoglycan-binding domain-containing protein [Clostridia bacterium]|nr:LysM peptidoglycan-binding domain-containing protein [Clostridia bacterium]